MQQQIPTILRDELEAFELVGGVPADPAIAVFQFECGRSPDHERDPLPVARDDLLEPIVDGFGVAEIMVLGEQLLEARPVVGAEAVDLEC